MKRISSFLFLLFFCLSSNGQTGNQIDDILESSLKSYISYNNNMRNDAVYLSPIDYYICIDGLPNGFSFENLRNVKYASLYNIDGLPSSFKKKLKNGLFFLFVTINLNNNKLIITVSGNKVTLIKKRDLAISLVDWAVFSYEFSCDDNRWILENKSFGGV